MNEKKKPGRFTLQFNLEDPQQKKVSDLLEQQGRHKAQFLTNAVLRYVQHPQSQESGNLPAVDEASLEQMLLTIIKRHPQFSSVLLDDLSRSEELSVQPPSANKRDTSMGADAMAAISETLAAFQQG